MKTLLLFACLIAGLSAVVADAHGQETKTDVPALNPEPRSDEWWTSRHDQKLKQKEEMQEVDLLWIGDSITHGWENAGKPVWEQRYASRNALNLGFSGDRTEHVLWRLQNGAVEGISPEVTVIMIGTNNTGHRQDPAEQTAAGVKAIIEELQTRLPETKILLLGVFPRGETPEDPLRKINTEINQILKTYADGERVIYQDVSDVFLADDGRLPKSVMPDLLHPNAEGYRLWAEAIEPTLEKLLSAS